MAKISPAKVDKALQVAAVIAASLSQNGTVGSDKAVRQCCLTGLRITLGMESVVACVEANPALLEMPLDDGSIWVLLNDEAKKQAELKAEKPPEESESADNAQKDEKQGAAADKKK